jgi:hypothetical protein
MTSATLPGFDPPITLDYWTGLPNRAIGKGGIASAKTMVLGYLLRRTQKGRIFTETNKEIALALGLAPGTINRALGQLARDGPPGIDHPYIRIHSRARPRQIEVLYRGRSADGDLHACSAQARAKDARLVRASARLHPQKPLENQGFAAMPLFSNSGEEKNNVNVVSISIPEKPPACTPAHAREAGAGPGPSVPDGIDPELAGLTDDQLRERIAALDARYRALANGSRALRVRTWCELGTARALLEAREGPQEPRPTPQVRSLDPAPAVAPAAKPAAQKPPSLPTVLGRLIGAVGPGPVEDFVRRMAEELHDDHSDGYFRGLARRIRCKEVDPKRVLEGVRRGRNAEARSRGAIFVAYVERLE